MTSVIEPSIPMESEHLEYLREVVPEAIGRSVCAFLNGVGGTVLIGVDENGEAVSIPDVEAALERVQRDLGEHLSPKSPYSITITAIHGKPCLAIDVPVGIAGPYVYRDGIFIRYGNTNRRAAGNDISALIQRRYSEPPRWERLPVTDFDLADLDHDEIRRTANEARERHYYELGAPDSPQQILERLNLAENGMVLNGSIVLFARQPERRYPQIRIRAVSYASDDPSRIVNNHTFEGHAFALLQQTQEFLRLNMPIAATLPDRGELARSDTPAYPWAAVREGLVNAVVHRDYAAYDGGLTVSLYPDRLELWNSGTLPDGLSVEALKEGHVSRPHNPEIAHVFLLRGLIERLGIGTRRIVSECLKAGLPEPEWRVRGGGLLLTLRLAPQTKPSIARAAPNRRQIAFLKQTIAGQTITAQVYHHEYAPDISSRQARTELVQLIQMGFIRSEGRGPATKYVRTHKDTSAPA